MITFLPYQIDSEPKEFTKMVYDEIEFFDIGTNDKGGNKCVTFHPWRSEFTFNWHAA